MHLLWISDSPTAPSGFGNVTRFVCGGLALRGYRVSILGWLTREPFEWNGCKVYATGYDPMGSDALFAFLVRHRPDAVIALADVWWLPFFTAPHVRRQMELTNTPWVLYFPIDGATAEERLPPSWTELLREVDVPVAMSRYGQRIANQCGIPCEYIPHGVDLDVFCPPPDREQAKARIGAEGKFLALSDSRNQPRKLLPRLLDVFARFAVGRPDALLHLHTDPDDEFAQSEYYSYDVRADVRHLGLESQVRFSPGFKMKQGGGLPLGELAAYYQAADVHLLASSGEGFGLPTLQAAAAGAAPLAGDYSASRELVEGHGQAIKIAGWSENEFGVRRALIDVDDAAEKLARYYNDRELLRGDSARARQFALSYGWSEIVDRWDRLLRSIGEARRRGVPSPFGRARRAEPVVQRTLPSADGVSVTVKMVQREIGRLEAAIAADARQRATDVRIPVTPPACEVARVRVPRRQGRISLTPPDIAVFEALKRVFPILRGTILHGPILRGSSARLQTPKANDAGLEFVLVQSPEDARYELAQSVLLLNVRASLPEEILVDAALYGVPCVGTGRAEAQRKLWPELIAEEHRQAVELARAALTDAARMNRISAQARLACIQAYAPDEEASAASLRRLHTARWAHGAV